MHVLAAGQCTQVENLGFFCVSDSWWIFLKELLLCGLWEEQWRRNQVPSDSAKKQLLIHLSEKNIYI